jgi:hypothetical protein
MIDTTWLSRLLLKVLRRATAHVKFRQIVKILLPVMVGLPALASFLNWSEFEGFGVVNIFRSVQLGLPWWLLFIPFMSIATVLLIFILPRFRGRYSITAYLFVVVPVLALAGIWNAPKTLIGYTGVAVSFLVGSLFIILALFIDYYEPSAPLENPFARFSYRGRYRHLVMLRRLASERKWEFVNPFQDFRVVNVFGEHRDRRFYIQSRHEIDPPRMIMVIGLYGIQNFPSVTILGGAISVPASFRSFPIWGKVKNSKGFLVPIYLIDKTEGLPSSYLNSIKDILESNRSLFDSRSRLDIRNNVITYQIERAFEMVAQERQIQQILEMLSRLVYLLERIPIT